MAAAFALFIANTFNIATSLANLLAELAAYGDSGPPQLNEA